MCYGNIIFSRWRTQSRWWQTFDKRLSIYLLCAGVICAYGLMKNKMQNQKNKPNAGPSPNELWYGKKYCTLNKLSFRIWKIVIIKFLSEHSCEDKFSNLMDSKTLFFLSKWETGGGGGEEVRGWQCCVCVTGFVVCNWIQINPQNPSQNSS